VPVFWTESPEIRRVFWKESLPVVELGLFWKEFSRVIELWQIKELLLVLDQPQLWPVIEGLLLAI
jgi:hypothetical protein